MSATIQNSELAVALAKAQGEMHNAPLNKVNPHYRSKYADLAAIRDATIPVLSKNGLSLVQYTTVDENSAVILRTKLMHTSGESIESAWPMPQLQDMQKLGAALTYLKRYAWSAMCGIAADEDDDANSVKGEDARPPAKPASKAPPIEAEKIAVAIPERPGLIPVPLDQTDDTAAAWKAWSVAMNSAISMAKSLDEVTAWLDHNADPLRNLGNYSAAGKKWEAALREKAHAQMEAFEKEAA